MTSPLQRYLVDYLASASVVLGFLVAAFALVVALHFLQLALGGNASRADINPPPAAVHAIGRTPNGVLQLT